MQDIVQLGSTTHNVTTSNIGTGYNSSQSDEGSPAQTYDGNFSTYYGGSAYGLSVGYEWPTDQTSCSADSTSTSEHTWTAPTAVTRVVAKLYQTIVHTRGTDSWPIGSATTTLAYLVQLRISGTWTTIFSGSNSGEVNIDSSTGWQNVTGIRVVASASGFAPATYDKSSQLWTTAYVYEVQAWGYEDIGLRYYHGGATYKIGVEALSASHKLRVRKGGVTYGIPLVTPDAGTTPIRIYDGTNVKAIPKTS